MHLPTITITAPLLLATIMASTAAQAQLVFPALDKKGKTHHFETTVSFKTQNDIECTSEQLAIIEEALVVSCNESHDAKKFHGQDMKIEEAFHGPAIQVAKTSLRSENWGRYWAWYKGSFGATCSYCDPDDDRRLMEEVMSLTEGKGGRVVKWQEAFCESLKKFEDFAGVEGCEILVYWWKPNTEETDMDQE